MDRRQQKTRTAILQAFTECLEKKNYESITVQEIIDKANVGRSTFYAHFETKDELLRVLCTDIFEHVFADLLSPEANHDFSSMAAGIEAKMTHILYHIKESKRNIVGILSGASGELFLTYFKNCLADTLGQYFDELTTEVPKDFLLNHMVGSFVEAIKWWIKGNLTYSPEEVARYYMMVTHGVEKGNRL